MACGNGGDNNNGDGNEEQPIALLPLLYNFAADTSNDPLPFCVIALDCGSLVAGDIAGGALMLGEVDQTTLPGRQGIKRQADFNDFSWNEFVDRMTDGLPSPLAAAFLVRGALAECLDQSDTDLQAQVTRPFPAVDLSGFEITGVALNLQSINRTPTQVTASGNVEIYGMVAAP